jgi:hypothetical protein
MSLYADILSLERAFDDDIRQDGDTWSVVCWELDGEHITGLSSMELALVIVRAIRAGYGKGLDAASYS